MLSASAFFEKASTIMGSENTKLRLGLDIGTNSIGWALVRCESEERVREDTGEIRSVAGKGLSIEALGSHIFPVGVAEDKYAKNSQEESKNIHRRQMRMARRLNNRYKLRRARLHRLLLSHGLMPPPGWERADQGGLTAPKLWELRAKALDEKVTLQDLGRVLLHLNQRRGFLSNRKEEAALASGNDKKETGKVKLGMAETTKAIQAAGARTIGEWAATLFTKAATDTHNAYAAYDADGKTIRGRFVHRSEYQKEFNMIWEQQALHYPDILTEALRRKLHDDIIYFQRPLKSAKHLVAHCSLEPSKKVAPKSSLIFQEFRLQETLARVQILIPSESKGYRFLTPEEKSTLSHTLRFALGMPLKSVIKVLGLEGREVRFNKVEGFGERGFSMKKNTRGQLAEALGRSTLELFTEEDLEGLWHTLYSSNTTIEEFIDHLILRHNLTQEQAHAVANIDLEEGYGSLSAKALRKIIPLMQEGANYADACKQAGYHHSLRDIDKEDRGLDAKLILDPSKGRIKNVKSPLVAKALSETYRLVNYLISRYGRPDEIVVEMARDLQKTKEEREEATKAIREVEDRRAVYRSFLEQQFTGRRIGRSMVRQFELYLQLYYGGPVDALIEVDLKEYPDFCRKIKVKEGDTKCRLWMEAGRQCPYTGRMIALSDLFSGQFEIEHIFPYSLSSDDSMANKTLCDRDFNKAAGNTNKALYIQSLGAEKWAAFQSRIKALPVNKQKRLLAEELPEGFLDKQLAATRWAARQLTDSMKTIARDVRTIPGGVTAVLRQTWGLEDNIFGGKEDDRGKNRYDHRHHAVDALVIACTRQGDVQRLSTLAGQSERGARALHNGQVYIDPKLYPAPQAVRYESVMEKVAGILVSYLKEKRLVVSRTNLYRWHKGNREGGKYKGVYKQGNVMTVRGSLHEETIYGRISNPHDQGSTSYVVRKSLSSFTKLKQLDSIIDPALRTAIKDYVTTHGGEAKMKELLASPLHLVLAPDGRTTLVKSVRIDSGATAQLPALRTHRYTDKKGNIREKHDYVEPGNNYLMAIYKGLDSKGREKQKSIIVSLLEAVERKRQGVALYPDVLEGSLHLWMTLQQNDLLVLSITTQAELEGFTRSEIFDRLYRVKKMSGNTLGLIRHNWSIGNPDYPKGNPDKKLYYTAEDKVAFSVSSSGLTALKVLVEPDGTLRPAKL